MPFFLFPGLWGDVDHGEVQNTLDKQNQAWKSSVFGRTLDLRWCRRFFCSLCVPKRLLKCPNCSSQRALPYMTNWVLAMPWLHPIQKQKRTKERTPLFSAREFWLLLIIATRASRQNQGELISIHDAVIMQNPILTPIVAQVPGVNSLSGSAFPPYGSGYLLTYLTLLRIGSLGAKGHPQEVPGP